MSTSEHSIRILLEQGVLDPATRATLRLVSKGVKADVDAIADEERQRYVDPLVLLLAPLMGELCRSNDEYLQLIAELVRCVRAPDPVSAYHGRSERNCIGDRFVNDVNVTARGLVLDRFLRLPSNGYDHLYGDDTYLKCLALTPQLLASWGGMQVLDVGSGNAFFAAEARVLFNINVTPVDLYAQPCADMVVPIYLKNMLFLRYLMEMNRGGAQGLLPQDGVLCTRLTNNLGAVVGQYRQIGVNTGDVTRLAFGDDSFDVALSSWMFCYLDDVPLTAGVAEMLRVTRPGGQIRICPGFRFGRTNLVTEDVVKKVNAGSKKKQLVPRPELVPEDDLYHHRLRLVVYDVVEKDKNCIVM